MKTYPVTGPDMLEPMWFNRVRQGQHAATVGADRAVTVEGVSLRLRAESPEPGTPVRVWLNHAGFFVCATVADIEQAAAEQRAAEAAREQERRARLDRARAEAEAFNARLALPVAWDVGIKDVLSGLSETSWGDGRSAATVEHVYLLEPLTAGRLVRQAGDFLCTATAGTNGKRWSSKVIERAHDGDGQPYRPRPTCKACLALAKRWMKD